MKLQCASCNRMFDRDEFRVQIPKAPVINEHKVRQGFITHKRCKVTVVVRESYLRNLEPVRV